MPVVFSARTSTDAGNQVGFGSDGGLHLPSPHGTSGGINQLYLIDNSWFGPGQSMFYTLPCTTAGAALGMPLNTAMIHPLGVAARAKPIAAQMWCSAAAAGSTLRCAVYEANPATGLPAAKLSDLWTIDVSATGARNATILDAGFTFKTRAMYWAATWIHGTAAANVWQTSDSGTYGNPTPMNQYTPPTDPLQFSSQNNRGLWDTSVAWSSLTSAPAAMSPSLTSSRSVGTRLPMVWWGLANQ